MKLSQVVAVVCMLPLGCAVARGQSYPDGRPAATLRLEARDQGVVLRHGDGPGQCDYLGAREALIFEEKGVYHLFYDGAGPRGWLACLATSKDLASWEKRGPILDFGKPGEPDSAAACSPWVYFDGETWHMFYLGTPNATGAPDFVPSFPYLTLKARSESLAGPWVKQPEVIPFRTEPGTYYVDTASPGHIVRQGGEYLMFFSASMKRTLGIARTRDLSGPWAVDPEPIVSPEEQIENSSLYFEPSNKTWFLFTNHIGLDAGNGEYTDAIWVYWTRDLNRWDARNKAVVLDGRNCTWSTKCIGMPSVIPVGKRLAILYDAPGGESVSHMERDIGLAWLDLPLSPPAQPALTPATSARTIFLTPVSDRASPQDDVFLAAVPAATKANAEPIVCAVDAESPWRPELLDYLRRYAPSRVVWLGSEPAAKAPAGLPLEVIPARSPAEGACRLAESFWATCPSAVAYRVEDRAGALAASALAARMRVPLFPLAGGDLPADVRSCLAKLGVSRLLVVGAPEVRRPAGAGFRVEHIADALSVARRLVREGLAVDYLAVVDPREGGAARSPRLSLSAALLATGRGGAVVPLPSETVWKRQFPAAEQCAAAPPGAHPSQAGHRAGTVALDGATLSFITGQEGGDGRWWAQFDLSGDGRYDGEGEGPIRTGGVVAIGGARYVVDMDVLENERGSAVWLTTPPPADIVACVGSYRRAVGREPRYLCLVGWPDAVPLAITGDAQGTDADLVTDHPYAQTDADPFVDMAFARFLAEDAASGTLLACRGLTLKEIREPGLAATYATAEWAKPEGSLLELAGLHHLGHHDGAAPIDSASPLTRAGAIVHDSHSMWTVLGNTYTWDSQVLLSPCIVVSSGCSPASLDQDTDRRSVAARMLRNGAVAFCGNGRRGIAQSALYRSELWNALLNGQTLGEAHRTALNRALVAILEKGDPDRASYRYQQDHCAAYGDPALDLGLRRAPEATAAEVEVQGSFVRVTAPRELTRVEYAPLEEWRCRYPRLWTWNALGLGTEAGWLGGDNYDLDDLVMTVEVRSRRRLVGVEPLDEAPPPLGWTRSRYVDEHSDGTRSLYWRCRFVDFDMTTGEISQQVAALRFRLLTE